jgi:nucleoside 2-deoxyribosyltransferase
MERIQTTEPSTKFSPKGEKPCILVYSSSVHVRYIDRIKNDIEKSLENKGFRIVYLKDEARDLHIYSDEFMKVAKDCVLGVVILDGFRPNVLFEFGVLMGLEKPIVLLKDKEAVINIRTLYGDVSNNDDCRKKTGLTTSEFDNLRNPMLEMRSCSQFSDLSMNISEFDKEVIEGGDKHVSKLLSSNIDKIRAEIEKEGEKIFCGKAPASMSDRFLDMYQEYVARLNSLALSPVFDEKDVDSIYSNFKNLETDSGKKMPSGIYSQIASLYKSAGEREEKDDS